MISPHFPVFNFKKINLVRCGMFPSFFHNLSFIIRETKQFDYRLQQQKGFLPPNTAWVETVITMNVENCTNMGWKVFVFFAQLARFKFKFSNLHYNVIQRGCEAFSD